MFTRQLALVSESNQISLNETMAISAALQKQITRDFFPIWNIEATIDAFGSVNDVPLGYWPIIIRDDIGQPGAGGFHTDSNGQPYALVLASEGTTIACSHEMIEMLVDPFGNRLIASNSIKKGQGRVRYLVEACDPCEGEQFGYTINGILVSDFYTPHFFDPVAATSVRYSYTSSIKSPRQVLPSGYLSWIVPATGQVWQAQFFGKKLVFKSLGTLKKDGRSWRECIDAVTKEPVIKRDKNKLSNAKGHKAGDKLFSEDNKSASSSWAKSLMEDIDG